MLTISHLQTHPLPPLSFKVQASTCMAIEGPSGSGKSRLMRAIADLDAVPGQVFLDGAERREMSGPEWRKLVRYVAAEPAWWTDTPRPSFGIGTEDSTRLDALLDRVGIPPGYLDRPVSHLSTGERQRLGLARALIGQPRCVLLDEPTSALDPQNAALIEELIRYLLLSGTTVLLASHDVGLTVRLADQRLQLGPPANGAGHAPANPMRGAAR